MIQKWFAFLGMAVCFVFGLVLGSLLSGQKSDTVKPALQMPPKAENQAQQGLIKHLESLESALAKDPGNGNLWVDLGNTLFDLNRPEQSIVAYERALQVGVRTADVLTDLGIMYRKTKQFDRALDSFKQAKALDAKHIQSRLNEGIVLFYDLSKTEQAVAAWEEVLALNPTLRMNSGELLSDLVEQLKKRGR